MRRANSTPPREQQVLGYWANKAPDAFGVDVSQSINRAPLCKRAHMPSLMPDGHYFLFEPPFVRPLLGKECMHMQGFPMKYLNSIDVDNHTLMDLAGNSFTASVFMEVLLATLASLSGAKIELAPAVGADTTATEVDELLKLVES